jgi:dimethylargininase
MGDCELTWLDRRAIDVELARVQHRSYAKALAEEGLEVVRLPAAPSHPDCIFVEDIVIDVGGTRIITAPGAASRRGERSAVREMVATLGPVLEMPESLRLDGGDVLQVRSTLYVGQSTRSDGDAMAWLAETTGRQVVPVPLEGVLHLKTGMTPLDENTLLAAPGAVDEACFSDFDILYTAPGEEEASNALRIPPAGEGERRLLMPSGFEGTLATVQEAGFSVRTVDISQFALAEAGLTCMSVLLGVRW